MIRYSLRRKRCISKRKRFIYPIRKVLFLDESGHEPQILLGFKHSFNTTAGETLYLSFKNLSLLLRRGVVQVKAIGSTLDIHTRLPDINLHGLQILPAPSQAKIHIRQAIAHGTKSMGRVPTMACSAPLVWRQTHTQLANTVIPPALHVPIL